MYKVLTNSCKRRNLISKNYNYEVNKTKQHCWLKNKIVYDLSFSKTNEEFAIYDQITRQIFNSFKLK
jgi:hypothetical protein